jgi:mannose-6-phosphate isomerase
MADVRDDILTDHRPWGSFTRYAHNQRCTVKVIDVAPDGVLSRQRHQHRDELWVALDTGLTFEIDGNVVAAEVGAAHLVPRGAVHRVRAGTDRGGRFLEVAFGTFDEDDIERLDDAYGRA